MLRIGARDLCLRKPIQEGRADFMPIFLADIPGLFTSGRVQLDVALLQLERPPAVGQVAKLGDSDTVQVGDSIFVVGAPFGISHSLTAGHVSARLIEVMAGVPSVVLGFIGIVLLASILRQVLNLPFASG